MKYRFKVEYNGTAFHGWQIQPNAHTVQAELLKAFKIATGQDDIEIWGSGRTDAGVSARAQVAAVVINNELKKSIRQLQYSINGLTNCNVIIRDLEQCPEDFNPRFEAKARYYIYTILTRPIVIGKDYGWDLSNIKLNLAQMQEEASSFIGTHDFDSFSVSRNDGRSTTCTIKLFRLEKKQDRILWHIEGNRFLHKQVRAMIGILTDIGKGRYPMGSVEQIFNNEFNKYWKWAPANGLCLEKVIYPEY